jgi:type II secretory pathway pseudopilin PulG
MRDANARRGPARAASAGYTYVGLLFLVALMGMALTLVSELWRTAQKREKEQELLFVGNQFRQALAMYSANGGGFPRKLEDLLKDPRVPGTRRYLRTIYRDPMTGRAEWGLVKFGDFITGVHSLSQEEPVKKAQFSLADQAFEGKSRYSDWVFSGAPANQPVNRPGLPAPQPGAK